MRLTEQHTESEKQTCRPHTDRVQAHQSPDLAGAAARCHRPASDERDTHHTSPGQEKVKTQNSKYGFH